MSVHPSDSSAQRKAEIAVLAALSEQLGFEVQSERIQLDKGCFIHVDGISRENKFACEVFCRVGRMKPAQVHKVATDILKLELLANTLGGKWHKAICFIDDTTASTLRGKSWLTRAASLHGVEILVVAVPDKVKEAVGAAQLRQVMVNRATP